PGNYKDVISSIDFMPTVLSAAGAKIPDALPGLNLMPLLKDGKKLEREAIFGESFAVEIADIDNPEETLLYRWCIEGKWKLILTYDGKVGRYGRFHKRENPEPLLYDLLADPMETTNLAAKNLGVAKRLAKRISGNWQLEQAKLLADLP
ncbi:MAG: hypothetical protein KAG66_14120, partial [Methylococcales bacterium]|nr:hypothetical protein [Methylococcales bacterium]